MPAQAPAGVDGLLAALDARPSLPGGGRVLAIDGPAGAGKTSLAREISDAWTVLPGPEGRERTVVVVHMDSLYAGWQALRDLDLAPRVRDGLLGPWANGGTGRCPAYDWTLGRFDSEVVAPPADLLVLEGVGAGMRDLADLRTLLAWVEAPSDVASARGLARDRELHEELGLAWDARAYRRHWDEFVTDQEEFFTRHGLPGAADVIVDGLRRRGR